jgi:hypothetical protein
MPFACRSSQERLTPETDRERQLVEELEQDLRLSAELGKVKVAVWAAAPAYIGFLGSCFGPMHAGRNDAMTLPTGQTGEEDKILAGVNDIHRPRQSLWEANAELSEKYESDVSELSRRVEV